MVSIADDGRGVPDAAARLNPVAADRLVPFGEAVGIVGFSSRTSLYGLVANGELPEPITRGRNRYFFQSDLTAYLQRLAQQRAAA